jgi:hypothetical protein
MIAIVVIGIVLAALVRPSMLWGMILSFLLLALSLTAILGILFCRGPRRAYWAGYALFAWVFFLLSWSSEPINSLLPFPGPLNTWYLASLELVMIPSLEPEKLGEISGSLSGMVTEVTDETRMRVAFPVVGLAFGALGGMIGRAFATSEARSKGTEDGPGRGGDEPPGKADPRG